MNMAEYNQSSQIAQNCTIVDSPDMQNSPDPFSGQVARQFL